MKKTNKDLIDELQDFYLEQNPKDIARALANVLIDIHRFVNIQSLGDAEKKNLIFRSKKNCDELENFAKHGPIKEFKLFNIEMEII